MSRTMVQQDEWPYRNDEIRYSDGRTPIIFDKTHDGVWRQSSEQLLRKIKLLQLNGENDEQT